MIRRFSLFTLLAIGMLVFVPKAVTRAADKPNIVVILADDFGYGSTNAYGADKELVQTPALDRLASEGKRFTHAYTASSVCSPTRYALLTGRYAWRTSLQHGVLNPYAPLHIGLDQLNVAALLKKHQYHTAAVGKWHLGYGNAVSSDARTDYQSILKPGPLEIGFDYHFGVPSNHGDRTGVFVENHYVYGLKSPKVKSEETINSPADDDSNFQSSYVLNNENNGRKLPAEDINAPRRKDDRVMNVLTKKATDWLDKQKVDEPFFLYFTPVAVHNPVTPSADLAGKSKAGPYGDWIHELDRSVDAILKKLDEKGLTENTLVLFTSDNGGVNRPENKKLLQTQAIEAGLKVNGALHGGKHTVWEGGFRVPYIVRWPAKVKAGSVNEQVVSVADLLATTAAIVGDNLPSAKDAAQDSHNVLSYYTSEDQPEAVRKDIIVHSAAGVFAIRKGDWKWIEGVPSKDANEGVVNNAGVDQNKPQLYNLKDDPAETKDVSEAHPEIVAELKGLLERYRSGGYSRELPSETTPSKDAEKIAAAKTATPAATPSTSPAPATTAPNPSNSEASTGKVLIKSNLDETPSAPWKIARGDWTPADGGLFGVQPEDGKRGQGALLQLPLAYKNATLRYELNLKGAQRQVIRIATTNAQRSFRIEVSPKAIVIVKNDFDQKGPDEAEELARTEVSIDKDTWVPVEVILNGETATVKVKDAIATGKHAVIGEDKSLTNFVVFGNSAGIKNVLLHE